MNGRIVIGIGAVTAAALAVAAGIIEAAGQNLQQPQPPSLSNDLQKVRVIASFFPLYDFARNVGGDRAEVSVMVPAGIEPHDWEPTPRDIADAENADMIVYNGAGFERWVSDINAKFAVDTSIGIQLMQGAEEGIQEESGLDPHIWLDPVLAKQQVEAIRDGFVQIDPVNSGYYHQNAQRYIAELDSLDSFIRSNLSNCELRDFIAFHNAFSYFANRYNLTQHSIQGISPEGDVLPQRIQEIKDLAATLGINVIYAEDLIDPRLANVIAGEIPNGQVLVLSPIEGLKREEIEQGLGYIDKMREDVQNLKVGLKCL
ncbi:MAG: zinc ABC transporter substrate-binding protein [Thermoproteota archaeon]|nr:zinc ABC transporter substrate-binding protein [Thermoproteota archaeon]